MSYAQAPLRRTIQYMILYSTAGESFYENLHVVYPMKGESIGSKRDAAFVLTHHVRRLSVKPKVQFAVKGACTVISLLHTGMTNSV